MKNIIQKLRSTLMVLSIAFVFSAFTADVSRDAGIHYKTSFTAVQSGEKQFTFYANNLIHVYLTNASVVPVAVGAQCKNTKEEIEPVVLLPQ